MEARAAGEVPGQGQLYRHVASAVTQGPTLIKGPSTLGLMLCSCCLEILNNSVFEFVFLSEV